MKATAIPSISENFAVQFRAEFFNALNRVNYGQPSANLFTQASRGGGNANPTAGQIRAAGAARQIEFALKVVF